MLSFKRFTSKQLNKIVERFRAKNKNISLAELVENEKYVEIIKYAVRQSLVRRADAQRVKTIKKIKEDVSDRKNELNELLENEYITKEKYDEEMENLVYKTEKKIYDKDLSNKIKEAPKNPKLSRTAKTIKKIARAVTLPFKMAYKGVKALGRKIQAIGRGGKVALLTSGKVIQKSASAVKNTVKNQIEPIAQEVKETENAKRDMRAAEKSKDLDETATIIEKRKIFDNSSKETQESILRSDFRAALRENKKYDLSEEFQEDEYNPEKEEREAKRRENLHMDKEQTQINYEEAIRRKMDEEENKLLEQTGREEIE